MQPIYLDHNSTTPLLAEVADAMLACGQEAFANPASQHAAGRRARQLLESAREGIASLLGADLTSSEPDQLIFTSGGTEANNLAMLGIADCGLRIADSMGKVLVSRIEHPSVLGPIDVLERRGWHVEWLRVNSDGVVQIADCGLRIADLQGHSRVTAHHSPASQSAIRNPQSAIAPNPQSAILSSLMLGSNETGVLQPVEQFAALLRSAGVPLHCDAVQVAGKLPIDFRRLGVATMSIAAHKFHGPRGIGALVVRHGVQLAPQLFGGHQQAGLRPGTEPVALVIGMNKALQIAHEEFESRIARMTQLRDRFELAIRAGWPTAIVHGVRAARLPHTSNIAFPGLNRQALLMALDLAGVACSTGSACASGSTDPSPTLVAMGLEKRLLESSLRFSLGATTTAAEVDLAVERILNACKQLQSATKPR